MVGKIYLPTMFFCTTLTIAFFESYLLGSVFVFDSGQTDKTRGGQYRNQCDWYLFVGTSKEQCCHRKQNQKVPSACDQANLCSILLCQH